MTVICLVKIGVEWSEIISMRNALAHGYNIIKHEILWDTATNDIPKLLTQLEVMLVQSISEDG